jgi:nitrilase
MQSTDFRVAVVQHPPIMFDRDATMQRAINLIDEAVGEGARLIVFPEAFIPGYPDWVWRIAPAEDLHVPIFAELQSNAVDLEQGDLRPLQEAVRRHGVTVVVGIDERDGAYSRTTLYNTLVTIGPDGDILNRHRKLMPTNPERMVWGIGDGSGLRVVETPSGRVGGLICWENYMPLARFALYAQGVEVYVASTWDEGDVWISTIRHIAKEGMCWVLGSGNCVRASDIPPGYPNRKAIYPDDSELINPGDSVIVAPGGRIVAGPLHAQTGILYAECDPAAARRARRTLDVAGHYARPDVLQLTVNRDASAPATFTGTPFEDHPKRMVRSSPTVAKPRRS